MSRSNRRQRGWAAAGMRSVAEQAGVSVKTIYDGFGSTAELFEAVIDVAAAGDDEPVMVMEREQFASLAATSGSVPQRAPGWRSRSTGARWT